MIISIILAHRPSLVKVNSLGFVPSGSLFSQSPIQLRKSDTTPKVRYNSESFSTLPEKSVLNLCVPPKVRFSRRFEEKFSKKACIFSANVIVLYPTGAATWIQTFFSSVFLTLFYCYFLHLPSYHLPCCSLTGTRKAMTHPAPGHRFFFYFFQWVSFSNTCRTSPEK